MIVVVLFGAHCGGLIEAALSFFKIMNYEVEIKFRVNDLDRFLTLCADSDIVFGDPVEENDLFYQHPARDFARTDECLRIRKKKEQYLVTYKGPKIDTQTKTRKEIEIPLPCDQAGFEQWDELLQNLGFQHAGNVIKVRKTANIRFENRHFAVTLDHLETLGVFVEIETFADETEIAPARNALLALAKKLQLAESIRTSYLEMLMKDHP